MPPCMLVGYYLDMPLCMLVGHYLDMSLCVRMESTDYQKAIDLTRTIDRQSILYAKVKTVEYIYF